jgi:hypothetical protein
LELGSKRSLGRLDGCWVVFGLVVLWGACDLVSGLFGRKKPPAGVVFLRIRQPRPERDRTSRWAHVECRAGGCKWAFVWARRAFGGACFGCDWVVHGLVPVDLCG